MADRTRSRWTSTFVLACFATAALAADELQSLDADFLSYLAEYEGEDDDWTIVEPTTAKPQVESNAKPAPAETNAPVATKAPSPPPPKADEQRSKP